MSTTYNRESVKNLQYLLTVEVLLIYNIQQEFSLKILILCYITEDITFIFA